MSRISVGLSMLSLMLLGFLAPPISAQNTTAALKAKSVAKEKLAPEAKAKPKVEQKAKAKGKSKSKRPPKPLQQQADELQIKSNALTSMTELLTDRRAKEKKRVEMMNAYLKSIGKLEDYENAKTPPPSNQGEMTYRHAVNEAVAHAKDQGGHCVDNPDEAEVKLLRRVYSANNRLAKKTWNEYIALRGQTRAIGAYLDSIDKADAYRKWAGVEADNQEQAYKEKTEADRKKGITAYKKRQVEEQKKREKIAAQERQDRQQALQRRFQLRQQRLYSNMREHSPGQSWGGWGDSYDDVHHHRRYYR